MRTRPSKTAEGTAAFRARECSKPESERVCSDPMAHHFLGRFYLTLGRHPWLGRAFGWLGERSYPGLVGAVLARTRFIDEHTRASLERDVGQVVILGAGFDTRAYRLADRAGRVRFFEVDHLATQTAKVTKLMAALGGLPRHVSYVAVDFSRDDLASRLHSAGYDSSARTLFIWEGVSYYLAAAAVDATLAFMARHSAVGSELLCDFFPRDVIDGTSPRRAAIALRKAVKRHGEPLLFGLDDEEVVPFLRARGFETVELVNAAACKDVWFHGANAAMEVSDMLSLVHAMRVNAGLDFNPERSCARPSITLEEES